MNLQELCLTPIAFFLLPEMPIIRQTTKPVDHCWFSFVCFVAVTCHALERARHHAVEIWRLTPEPETSISFQPIIASSPLPPCVGCCVFRSFFLLFLIFVKCKAWKTHHLASCALCLLNFFLLQCSPCLDYVSVMLSSFVAFFIATSPFLFSTILFLCKITRYGMCGL